MTVRLPNITNLLSNKFAQWRTKSTQWKFNLEKRNCKFKTSPLTKTPFVMSLIRNRSKSKDWKMISEAQSVKLFLCLSWQWRAYLWKIKINRNSSQCFTRKTKKGWWLPKNKSRNTQGWNQSHRNDQIPS